MDCPNCGHDRLTTHRPTRTAQVDTRHIFCEQCHMHFESETRITHVYARRSRGPAERVTIEEFKTILDRS